MIRSLNNVAQVEELRPAMMNEHFIVICCDFMFLIEFEVIIITTLLLIQYITMVFVLFRLVIMLLG